MFERQSESSITTDDQNAEDIISEPVKIRKRFDSTIGKEKKKKDYYRDISNEVNTLETEYYGTFGAEPIKSPYAFPTKDQSAMEKLFKKTLYSDRIVRAPSEGRNKDDQSDESEEYKYIVGTESSEINAPNNVGISIVYKKDDPFVECSGAKLNVAEMRERRSPRFSGIREDEIERDITPEILLPKKEKRKIGEDQLWMSDVDKELLRFTHKPPLSQLRNIQDELRKPKYGMTKEQENKRIREYATMLYKEAIPEFLEALKKNMLEYLEEFHNNNEIETEVRIDAIMREGQDKCRETIEAETAKIKQQLTDEKNIELDNFRKCAQEELDLAVHLKEQEIKEKYAFLASHRIMDHFERTQIKMGKFIKRGAEWLRRAKTDEEERQYRLENIQEIQLDRKKIDLEEQYRNMINEELSKNEKKHRDTETCLLSSLAKRIKEAENQRRENANLVRNVEIWSRLAKDIFIQYQKFVTFSLKDKPMQTQYMVDLQKLYQIYLDESLRGKGNKDRTVDIETKLFKLKTDLSGPQETFSFDDDSEFNMDMVKTNLTEDIIQEALQQLLSRPEKLERTDSSSINVEVTGEDNSVERSPNKQSFDSVLSENKQGKYINLPGRESMKISTIPKVKQPEYESLETQSDSPNVIGEKMSVQDLPFEEFKDKRTKDIIKIFNRNPGLFSRFIYV